MIVKVKNFVQITATTAVRKLHVHVNKLYGFVVVIKQNVRAIAIYSVIVMDVMDVTYMDAMLEVAMEYAVHRLGVMEMEVRANVLHM